MNPALVLILLLAAAGFIAYVQKKDLSLQWLGISFLCFVTGSGVINQAARLFPLLPGYMEPLIYGFVYGTAVWFADKFAGMLLLKKLLKEYPGLVNKKGCFTYGGIGAEKPPSLMAYFTINYPDGSSKLYPARFYIKEGQLVKAAFKTVHREPWDNLEADSSPANIAAWKHHRRLYAQTNYQRAPEA